MVGRDRRCGAAWWRSLRRRRHSPPVARKTKKPEHRRRWRRWATSHRCGDGNARRGSPSPSPGVKNRRYFLKRLSTRTILRAYRKGETRVCRHRTAV
eukprot:1736057-Pleurochrysis_carterae.AAC.1